MSEHLGPIYEVTLNVDAEVAAGLDDWLASHVAAMLEHAGFSDADISNVDERDGKVGRVVRYFVASDEDLDHYLAGAADAMRQQTVDKFGEQFEVERRVLHDSHRPSAQTIKQDCLNCGANLSGQYCGQCGQRAQSRLISVWELLKDALGDVLDVDSRLWQTLIQLAIRPGLLTRNYLQGRRARYLPPFRTYLVLSLVFFVVAFFDPRENLSVFFEPASEVAEPDESSASSLQEITEDVVKDLEAEGIEIQPPDASDDAPQFRMSVGGEEVGADCNFENYEPEDLPGWLGRRLSRDRVQAMCLRMTAADGQGLRGFLDRLLDYVPVGLFVLLPLMALVLKALYPLSKRYYVEHLLFIIHFHAFVFLALLTQILISRLGALAHMPETARGIVIAIIALYIPIYLYKMLRRVYQQGHWFSVLKFVPLCFAYWFGLSAILFTVAVLAAFSA